MAWPALTITDPVAMSNAAKRLVVAMALCNRECDARLAGQHLEGSAGYGSAPESDSFHPRTAQRMMRRVQVQADDVSAPCRPAADRWIVETSRCDEDATRTLARCDSPWIDSSRSSLPTRDCSNALLLWDLFQGQAYGPFNAVIADLSGALLVASRPPNQQGPR